MILLMQWVSRLLRSDYLVMVLCAAYFLIMLPIVPGFASGTNLLNLVALMIPLLLLAVGQSFVLITGNIDLSITSTLALAGVTGAMVMNGENGWLANHALGVPMGILLMLAVALLAGLLNGISVAFMRMPSFLVTLVTMMVFSGLAVWFTRSQTLYNLPSTYVQMGSSLGWSLTIGAVVVLASHLILSRTVFGEWIYATGLNARAAQVSGVPVRSMIVAAYVIAALCAVIAGILLTGQLESASPALGKRLLLDVIGATIIGGTSLFGGVGKVHWTLFGVVFLSLVDNSMNLIGVSFAFNMLAKGGVILFAAFIDAYRRRVVLEND